LHFLKCLGKYKNSATVSNIYFIGPKQVQETHLLLVL
jgi:hypothetical protein